MNSKHASFVAAILFLAVLATSLPLAAADFDWDIAMGHGDTFFNSGDYAGAERHYRNALGVAERLKLGDRKVAASLQGVANSVRWQGKLPESEALYRRALALRERALPPNDVRLADTLSALGQVLAAQNREAEAEAFLLRGLAIYNGVADADACHHGNTLNALAVIQFRQRQLDRAQALYERALAVLERPDVPCPIVAGVLANLNLIYLAKGQPEKSEPLLRRSIALLQHDLGTQDPKVAMRVGDLAFILAAQKKYEEAGREYERAIGLLDAAGTVGLEALPTILNNYAAMLRASKRAQDAERVEARISAMNRMDVATDASPERKWQALMQEASGAQGAGRLEEAARLLENALLEAAKLGAQDERKVTVLGQLAQVRDQQAKPDEAEALWRRALKESERDFGAASLQAANAGINLAVFYASHGKMDAAEKAFLESIALREQLRDRANSGLSMALGQLASFYQSQQRYGEAEARYQRAISLDEATLGAEHPRVSGWLFALGNLYVADKKYELSEQTFLRVLAIGEKTEGKDSPMLTGVLWALKELMKTMGKAEAAQQFEARRLAIEAKARP